MNALKAKYRLEWLDYKVLMKSTPAFTFVMFVVSVVLMNLLANKEIDTRVSWLALDCGITVSWLSFLCMDMLTKRFGASAAIKLSLTAMVINLFVCLWLFVISNIPGNWGEFYTFEDDIANQALNNTVGGTWYAVLGSSIAFAVSAAVNAVINEGIGKLTNSDSFAGYALRSYVSTIIAQFVDNMVFALTVSHIFFGWSLLQCFTCSLTGCIVELLCEVAFSPIGYAVCSRWKKDGTGAQYIRWKKDGSIVVK